MAYSDKERTEAMVRLAINKYDYHKTADELGINHQSLRNWEKQYAEIAVPEMLDRAVNLFLAAAPYQKPDKDWAVTIGILLDKWLLLQGEATSRSESFIHGIENISDEERQQVIARAREIVEAAGLGGGDAGELPGGASAGSNGKPPS